MSDFPPTLHRSIHSKTTQEKAVCKTSEFPVPVVISVNFPPALVHEKLTKMAHMGSYDDTLQTGVLMQ